MNLFLQYIELCLQKNIAFAAFQAPGKQEKNIYILDEKELDSSAFLQKKSFVIQAFDNKIPMSILACKHHFKENERNDGFYEYLQQLPPNKKIQREQITESTDFKTYQSNFKELHEKLRNKHLEKVVLSKTNVIPFERPDSAKLFFMLCQRYPQAFVSLFNHPAYGLWCSASPETLLKMQAHECMSMSLAGTLPLNAQWSEKEKQEQALVTNYITDAIKQFPIENFSLSILQDFHHRAYKHLKNVFHFRVKNKEDIQKIIQSLHPTPAVCGIPKEKAKEAIRQVEKHNRKLYTGFIGPVYSNTDAHFFVNIRCMQIFDEHAIIYTGGGLTQDSRCKNEWEECNMKENTILEIVQAVNAEK